LRLFCVLDVQIISISMEQDLYTYYAVILNALLVWGRSEAWHRNGLQV